jgi:Glutaredoxin-like domain (DUF836)
MRVICLYGRPGCHLCEDAREAIEVEQDERLLARMLERIPVVELDGEIVSELSFEADRLRARMSTLSQ